jgi:hypothetical protein
VFFNKENRKLKIYKEDFIQSFFELQPMKKKHKKYEVPVLPQLPPQMPGRQNKNNELKKKIGKFFK